jgi:hypothetical protein
MREKIAVTVDVPCVPLSLKISLIKVKLVRRKNYACALLVFCPRRMNSTVIVSGTFLQDARGYLDESERTTDEWIVRSNCMPWFLIWWIPS